MNSELLERKEEIYNNLLEQGLDKKYKFPGIYSISIEGILVYIGKSRDMLERITNHILEIETNQTSNKYRVLRQAREGRNQISFDVLYYSPCLLEDEIIEDIGQKEGELIRKHLPPLNYQIPKIEDFRKYNVNKKAMKITLKDIMEGRK